MARRRSRATPKRKVRLTWVYPEPRIGAPEPRHPLAKPEKELKPPRITVKDVKRMRGRGRARGHARYARIRSVASERRRRFTACRVSAGVKTLCTLTARQAREVVVGCGAARARGKWDIIDFVEPRPIMFLLDYPLGCRVPVEVLPYQSRMQVTGRPATQLPGMTVGWILWCLARAYRSIYRSPKKYGVWGHCLGDLCFEKLVIRDCEGQVFVGS